MKKKQQSAATQLDFARTLGAAVRVGQVLGVNDDHTVVVDYPGNPATPVVARMLTSAANDLDVRQWLGQQALLVFENGDAQRPIVIGLLANTAAPVRTSNTLLRDHANNVQLNGKQLKFDGSESVAIVCGKSSIVMHADGRVVIKGTRLVSRAAESNKIKGATIDLN